MTCIGTPSLYTVQEVAKLTKLGRTTIYRMVAAGKFPRPFHIGDRSTRFDAQKVHDYITERAAAADEA